MRIVKLVFEQSDGRAGCPHTMQSRVLNGEFLDAVMSGQESLQEKGSRVAGRVSVRIFNHLDGDTAGFLAAFVSAHTVSDDGEAALLLELLVARWLPVGVAVFVVLALSPDVSESGQFDSGTNLHEKFWIIQN